MPINMDFNVFMFKANTNMPISIDLCSYPKTPRRLSYSFFKNIYLYSTFANRRTYANQDRQTDRQTNID